MKTILKQHTHKKKTNKQKPKTKNPPKPQKQKANQWYDLSAEILNLLSTWASTFPKEALQKHSFQVQDFRYKLVYIKPTCTADLTYNPNSLPIKTSWLYNNATFQSLNAAMVMLSC